MSYHHRRKHRAGLRMKKHHWVLTFIAAVVVILYAFAFTWEVAGHGWARIWRSSHRHRWVDASPPGSSGHRR